MLKLLLSIAFQHPPRRPSRHCCFWGRSPPVQPWCRTQPPTSPPGWGQTWQAQALVLHPEVAAAWRGAGWRAVPCGSSQRPISVCRHMSRAQEHLQPHARCGAASTARSPLGRRWPSIPHLPGHSAGPSTRISCLLGFVSDWTWKIPFWVFASAVKWLGDGVWSAGSKKLTANHSAVPGKKDRFFPQVYF